MRKIDFNWFPLLIAFAMLNGIVAIVAPVFQRVAENKRPASCQSNLKQIALGLNQYVQDYDEKYPVLTVSAKGYWAGGIQPYLIAIPIKM